MQNYLKYDPRAGALACLDAKASIPPILSILPAVCYLHLAHPSNCLTTAFMDENRSAYSRLRYAWRDTDPSTL